MNGQAFANLPKLVGITFQNNYCIDDSYGGLEKTSARKNAVESISKKCGFKELDFVEVACERFEGFGDFDLCIMDEKTAINATNFIIADLKDEEVGCVQFTGNKRIEYLPYKIFMQYPNLVEYRAGECSIKEISKENFEKLDRMYWLKLHDNQIEKISGDTFKGLESLECIDLCEYNFPL